VAWRYAHFVLAEVEENVRILVPQTTILDWRSGLDRAIVARIIHAIEESPVTASTG
jgi:hypothetical protein